MGSRCALVSHVVLRSHIQDWPLACGRLPQGVTLTACFRSPVLHLVLLPFLCEELPSLFSLSHCHLVTPEFLMLRKEIIRNLAEKGKLQKLQGMGSSSTYCLNSKAHPQSPNRAFTRLPHPSLHWTSNADFAGNCKFLLQITFYIK